MKKKELREPDFKTPIFPYSLERMTNNNKLGGSSAPYIK